MRKVTGAESAIHPTQLHYVFDAMPQSLSKVILYIIFSTKNREPWLDLQVRPRMHVYLATICRDLGGDVVRVGGMADHISHCYDFAANSFPGSVH